MADAYHWEVVGRAEPRTDGEMVRVYSEDGVIESEYAGEVAEFVVQKEIEWASLDEDHPITITITKVV